MLGPTHDPETARSPRNARFSKDQLLHDSDLSARLRVFAPVVRVCFRMFPRNRFCEKREAAAIARNARIQILALPQNTHGTHMYAKNEGPGPCPGHAKKAASPRSSRAAQKSISFRPKGSPWCAGPGVASDEKWGGSLMSNHTEMPSGFPWKTKGHPCLVA